MGLLDSQLILNGKPHQVRGLADRSLLDALAELDVHLPAACGGHGSCGLCKCRLPRISEAPSSLEKPYLSQAEQADGTRLACQQSPRAGLEVEITPAILGACRVPVRVAAVERLSPNVLLLRVQTVSGEDLDFIPGQWARLSFGFGTGREHRAFSYASPPGDDQVEFLVARVPGGRISGHIHDQVAVGDPLDLIGPFGEFQLHDQSGGPMLWIAGGSGLAPFRAMLQDLLASGRLDEREIHLHFFGHDPGEMFLHGWLQQLSAGHRRFHYHPSVSENRSGLAWDGALGRLPQVLRLGLAALFGRPGAAPQSWQGYLCGAAGLVEAGRAILRASGMPDDAIFFDRFI